MVLAAAGLALSPASAEAHPSLLQTSPSPGLIAPKAPAAIQLSFSEAAVPDGSRIELGKLAGAPVPVGALQATNGGQTLSVSPRDPLQEGVYEVKWSALGDDGHLVSGSFAFGVAGPHGEAPSGAQALVAFGSRGGGSGQSTQGESVVSTFARWLALLAAAFLFGGLALIRRLGRALDDDAAVAARERWRFAARLAWPVMLFAAAEGVIAAATAGADGSFDLGALTTSPTGRGQLIQLGLLGAAALALILLRGRPRACDALLGAGAAVVLVTQGVTGHVQALSGGRVVAASLQTLHVASAGLWLGGLLALIVVTWRGREGEGAPFGASARAFAPLAVAALGLSAVTGLLAAFREVDAWYFLRWSAYGHVVVVKTALVLLAAAAGGIAAWRARRGAASHRLLRAEAVVVIGIVALGTVLAGLAPGRGQALPAERGTLLPGPALATAIGPRGPLRVTLAPARAGGNVLSVVEDALPDQDTAPNAARQVEAKLYCSCSPSAVTAKLTRGRGGTWHSSVALPDDGSWYARLTLDGHATSPVALPVGVPTAPGPGPLSVLSIADLSGPDADRCRAQLMGLELAVGRINALGGLDGGRKVAVLALDDGGSAARARRLAQHAMSSERPLALVAPCGPAAAAAVQEAGRLGVPSVVADPAVPPVNAPLSFRLAGDPYAEGYADAQFIRTTVQPSSASKTVTFVQVGDVEGDRRLAGLRSGLRGSGVTVKTIPPSALGGGPDALRGVLDRNATSALLLDGLDPETLAGRLSQLGTGDLNFAPAVVLASSRVLSENLVTQSGALGRIGAVQGPSEVSPDSATSLVYARAVPALYPGEHPSLDGLRGYVAGLALQAGVAGGTSPDEIAERLQEPAPFTDALLAPWRSDAPSAGSQRFEVLAGNFLPATLIPVSKGGESYSGSYFANGSWRTATTQPYGPPFDAPLPSLVAGRSALTPGDSSLVSR